MFKNITKQSIISLAVISLVSSCGLFLAPKSPEVVEIKQETEAKPVVSSKYGANAKACLVEGMYFEARGTGYKGLRAVGEVILNRSDSPKFPNGACNALNQYYNGTCQFSYICDGIPDRYREPNEKAKAERIADELLNNRGGDITHGAIFFHAKTMKPNSWFRTLHRIGLYGGNIFYK